MIISMIAAMTAERVIGVKNSLPWDIPEDLNYFKEKTKNKIIIMGRKTFESLPKPLPNRLHIIISRSASSKNQNSDAPLIFWAPSLSEALSLAKTKTPPWPEEIFIIGGGEIYTQGLEHCDLIYLTLIHHPFKGDSYFPNFDQKKFRLIADEMHTTKSVKNPDIKFEFQLYKKQP